MKFTWGTGIFLAFVLFAGLIISFVVRANLHKVDMAPRPAVTAAIGDSANQHLE